MRNGSLYAYIYKLSYINNTTWSNLDVSVFHSLTPGGRVFLASNLDASLLQPLEAPGIS